ncbi:PREDICTED: phospholipase A2 inhibitor subunit gamma B-like [Gekko japonicus]|uniref:Phospholipase A2 inhibitor subunit gamma B-like n=1 Tax=Gekko japonicus TaxID=146911 RepID=A0ABM1LD03_GEKJA|nr:PREDICTED: phospholipase A2 inhibitor subunit gamma B-like [Gekko japonicus]
MKKGRNGCKHTPRPEKRLQSPTQPPARLCQGFHISGKSSRKHHTEKERERIVPRLLHSVPPVTMKALLGLLLLSVLLTSGYSLECETCSGQGTTCTGRKVTCSANEDTCLNAVTEVSAGAVKISTVMKSCFVKEGCDQLKPGSTATFGGAGALIKTAECSRAPVSSGSFLLALSSLLFLKFLW